MASSFLGRETRRMTPEQNDGCRKESDLLPKQDATGGDGQTGSGDDIRHCVAYAEEALRKMAEEVARNGYSGTIGIEIPVEQGKLGKVKRLKIFFQQH